MRHEGSIVGTLAFILFGPIVWALHLLAVYGSHASSCAVSGAPGGRLSWTLGGATLVAILALLFVLASPATLRRTLRAAPPESGVASFAVTLMRLLSVLSLFGVFFAGIAILVLPECLQAR